MSGRGFVVGTATHVGRVREGNEDSHLAEPPLFAVADGMGGHRGGEVASALALEAIGAKLKREGHGDLAAAVREANLAVFERQTRDSSVSGMGTTLTAAIAGGDSLQLAHVGDSRAYVLRAGELRLLTEDHTIVHRMVKEGRISEAEARVHPQRSILTRALGVDVQIEVDELTVPVVEGDRFLLCTDGLTAMLEDDEVKLILVSATDPQEAADTLVEAANEAGGVDNTTAIVIDVRTDDEESTAAGEAAGRAGDPPPSRKRRRLLRRG